MFCLTMLQSEPGHRTPTAILASAGQVAKAVKIGQRTKAATMSPEIRSSVNRLKSCPISMSQPRRTPLLQAVIVMFLITSCRPAQNPATIASAEGFVTALVKRLESKGTVKSCPQGSERTGNIHSKEFTHLISASILSADDVYSLATQS